MERPPEEDGDYEYCEKGIYALFEFLGHSQFLFGGVFHALGSGFLGGCGEFLLAGHEDEQRDNHCGNRGDERIVDTGVEDVEVVLAHFLCCCGVSGQRYVHIGKEFSGLGNGIGRHRGTDGEIFVAESGKVGVVSETVYTKPPAAEQGRYERSNQTSNVDEHIENLEAGVTLTLGLSQSFGAYFSCFSLEVVVHLAYDSLQVAFEKAVTEGNHQQGKAGQRQKPVDVACSGEDDVSASHNQKTRLNGCFVVLCAVGNDTANQAKDVDAAIKSGVDTRSDTVAQSELRAEEQNQDRIHNIVAETLTHIAQCGCN